MVNSDWSTRLTRCGADAVIESVRGAGSRTRTGAEYRQRTVGLLTRPVRVSSADTTVFHSAPLATSAVARRSPDNQHVHAAGERQCSDLRWGQPDDDQLIQR
jgi:hypothetical protein